MQNEIGCFLKGLGTVFAILLALLLPAVLFGFNIAYVLLDGDVYKRAMVEANFYTSFPALFAEGALAEEQFESPLNLAQYVEAVQYLAENVFEDDWLQAEIEVLIDDVFAYVNGETDELKAGYSFVPMVDAMKGERGKEVIRTYLEMLPECLAQDTQNNISALEAGDFHLPYCQPPEEQLDALVESIQTGFLENMEDPETITPIMIEADYFDQEVLSNYRTVRQVMLYSPLALLLLVVVIVALVVRSVDELLKWTGVPLGLGSLFALLMAGIGYLYSRNDLQQRIVENSAEDTFLRAAELLGGIAAEVFGIYFRMVLIEAGVLLMLSMVALAFALVARRMTEGFE